MDQRKLSTIGPEMTFQSPQNPSRRMSHVRRMSRMMHPRLSRERLSTFGSHDSHHPMKLENTYRMEPNRKVRSGDVKRTITSAMQDFLEEKTYAAHHATQWSKELSNIIKSEVKLLGYPRHKIVALVSIGSKEDVSPSTISFCSQAVWQPEFDSFTEGSYENKTLYAVALVYTIYLE